MKAWYDVSLRKMAGWNILNVLTEHMFSINISELQVAKVTPILIKVLNQW